MEAWRGRMRRWGPVFGAAVVVRLAYWAIFLPRYVPIADGDQYRRLGQALADGKGFSLVYPQMEMHPTAFRPPLYPLVLAPGNLLFGHALWPGRLTSVLLGSLAVVLAGVLAARIGGRRAGLATAVIVLLYPPLLANDTVVMTEALAVVLLLGAILLADDRRWLWSGAVLGLLALTRPNVYLVAVVLAAWAWWQARRVDGSLAAWRAPGLLLAAMVGVLLPWLVRNQVQVHTFRPTTSDGLTLVAVYGPRSQAVGTFVDPVFSPVYGDLDHRLAQFDEGKWNQKLTREAIDGLKQNPRYVGHVLRQNFRGYFELDTSLNRFPEDSDGRNWRVRQDTLPLFFLVTIAGLVGLVRRRRDPRVVVLAAVTAQFVVLSLLLVAPPRLRTPFDLAMAVGAGLLVGDLLDRRASAPPVDVPGSEQPAG